MAFKTVRDLVNEMSEDQLDLQAIVVAATVNNLSVSDDILASYAKLPDEVRGLTEFIVGYALQNAQSFKHADILEDELAHFGVKGMRWGVRKDDGGAARAAKAAKKDAQWLAREKVKAGTGTLGDAHDAAIKSTGHRLVNGVLGDKTYWKRSGLALLVAGTTIAGANLAADQLPSGMMGALGGAGMDKKYNDPNDKMSTGNWLGPKKQTLDEITGRVYVAGIPSAAALTLGTSAVTFNYAKNVGRAVKGNKRIEESKKDFVKYMADTQYSGAKAIQKTLTTEGRLSKRKTSRPVQHIEEYTLEGTLAHYGVKGQKWGVIRRAIVGSGPSSKDIKKARAVITDPAAQKGYSRRELKGLNRTARRKTLGERAKTRTKQAAVLAIGAAVAKEYLEINGSQPMPSASRNLDDDGGMMFNPNATLDPSQVEVRR